MVKAIESYDEWKALTTNAENIVVVDYWATWCGPCKMISPHFAKLEDKFPSVKFVKVDVEEQEDVAKEAAIKAMPTFIAYKDGKPFKTITGAAPAKITVSAVVEYLGNGG
ncbi:thioredoxin [Cryptococcus wingfieldii CBS 7118]|uniref:Thioredoxin n=1 Tax=Cryptococcus wingfieldii CBS 7118 TaxID=1295528 RepID=A0A1E3K310_9TREE|nr:thioredoxin [Cryptococcus wingfieldii CBS 7118]ODO07333.1 thioredoxin [Cryptococcus wingfieldii CBS 7118]